MSDIFVTADLHLGHEAVAGLRGLPVKVHDEIIMSNLCDLSKRDQLWILGDLTLGGSAAEERALALLGRVKAELHFIAGNHDSCHPAHRNAHRKQAKFLEVFASVSSGARKRVNGKDVLLSHFPFSGDHGDDDRYSQWRLRDEGTPIIHGHTHATEVLSFSRANTPQACVSVDAWNLQPAPLEVAASYFRPEVDS